MGALLSKCTIRNDTDFGVWIKYVMNLPVGGGVAKAIDHLDRDFTNFSAHVISQFNERGNLKGVGCLIMGDDGVRLGHTTETSSMMESPTSWAEVFKSTEIDTLKTITNENAFDYQTIVKNFCEPSCSVYIPPHDDYKWRSTASMHMRVYVMNEKLQIDKRICFTNPRPGGEWVYPLSEYFLKLDQKKTEEDKVIVYLPNQP